jgi:formylglycine-generating enzyme required for sulfatase activity
MKRLLSAMAFAFGLLILAQSIVAEEPREALSTFKDCDLCPQLVVIPEGSFMMGSPVDELQRGTREGPARALP